MTDTADMVMITRVPYLLLKKHNANAAIDNIIYIIIALIRKCFFFCSVSLFLLFSTGAKRITGTQLSKTSDSNNPNGKFITLSKELIAYTIKKVNTNNPLHIKYVFAWYPPVNERKNIKPIRNVIPAKTSDIMKLHNNINIILKNDDMVISIPYLYISNTSESLAVFRNMNLAVFSAIFSIIISLP